MPALGLLLPLSACADDPPDLVRKTIGAAGGLVSSHDEVLTLVFQPGAFTGDQEIVIFPSDAPPAIFGPAYRVKPDIELMVDVEVSYRRVLPANTGGVAVSAIHLNDYIDDRGYWASLPRLALDEPSATVLGHDAQLSLYYGLIDNGSTELALDTRPTAVTGECGNADRVPGEVCYDGHHYPTGGGALDVGLGDFDGDGQLDVATINTDGTHSIRLGDGRGGFGLAVREASGLGATSLGVTDLDRDGADDLVIARTQGPPRLLRSTHDGHVTTLAIAEADPHQLSTAVGAADPPEGSDVSLTLAEAARRAELRRSWTGRLTEQSTSDLVIADHARGGVHMLLAGAQPHQLERILFVQTGAGAVDVVAADITGDARLELLVANAGADEIVVVEQTGQHWGVRARVPVSGSPSGLDVGDLDADGVADIVVSTVDGGLTVLVSSS